VKLELNKVRRDIGAVDSGSEDEEEGAGVEVERGDSIKADKGTSEEGRTGELSIPLMNRATGYTISPLRWS
jgi:hypothetical protein